MNIGIWELVVILVIVALLFGTRKLGSIGVDVGNAIKGFRAAMRDDSAAQSGTAARPPEKDPAPKDQSS
ncbi:MAG: twin-arginine translocase TatA/TatE family subunit [Gammaproteobacteria bacterium]|nr:twin-arginine translocase TatA/TatE family subunit [Gammaproteobacteria bacterium]